MRILIYAVLILFISACEDNLMDKESIELIGIKISPDSTMVFIDSFWVVKDTTIELRYPCTIDSMSYILFQTFDDSLSYKFGLIPDSSLSQVNHGLGQWIRNSYGLWSRTCIVEEFWGKGIMHPDDMSAIILTNYHRVLNGKSLNIDAQIYMYKSFWKNEFEMEYRLQDSFDWDFPPSMWDMGITQYKTDIDIQ